MGASKGRTDDFAALHHKEDMSIKIMVAYDGTLQAKAALKRGIEKAREQRGEIVVLSVFNRALFVDYDVSPRALSIAREEFSEQIGEVRAYIKEKAQDIRTSLFSADGDPDTVAMDFAKGENIDMLLCPPSYRRIIAKYREGLSGNRSGITAPGMRTAELVNAK